VEKSGTLVIRRQERPSTGPTLPVYTLALLSSPSDRDAATYRCHGDLALLRALEELLTLPDLRLETLERVRDRGEAVVREVVVPELLATKYKFGDKTRHEWNRVERLSPMREQLCAVCSQPTGRTDRLTMLNGEVVHYACRPESRDATEVAHRLLSEASGQGFCHSCLASLLHISFDEARKVVGKLRIRSGFTVGTGQCSVCGRFRFTLGFSVVPEPEPGQ
jgi:hypothetical protein